MRLFVRLTLVGLVVLVGVGFWLNQSQPSPEAIVELKVSNSQCSEPGISLVIDFGTGSDKTGITKCVSEYQGNSWDLLKAAGLEIAGTKKYPVGFVCRMNSFPDENKEKCLETPNAKSGSWAYFLAAPGETEWTYSNFGAASHKAKCGWAEGWRFLQPDEPLTLAPRVKPQTKTCEQ